MFCGNDLERKKESKKEIILKEKENLLSNWIKFICQHLIGFSRSENTSNKSEIETKKKIKPKLHSIRVCCPICYTCVPKYRENEIKKKKFVEKNPSNTLSAYSVTFR